MTDTSTEAVDRLAAKLTCDDFDPEDVVLWFGDEFAGNVGHRFQKVGQIFDVDREIGKEMERRWNGYAALAAERDALLAEVDTLIQNNHLKADAIDRWINTSAAQHQAIKLRKTREDASRIREAIDNLEIPKGGLPNDRIGVWVLALNMVIEVIDKETTDD
jgi:hypothetical protein